MSIGAWRRLTRACSRRAGGGPSSAHALPADGGQRNVGLCGHGLEGPQLMRMSLGGRVQITVSSAMHLLSFGPKHGTPITGYHSHGASAVRLGSGRGESHVYCIYLGPGGEIGPHGAGFDQLFLILAGSGWVSGADGVRKELRDGEGALIARGEIHAKGSTSGLTAIMVQLTELTAASAPSVA